MLEDNRDILEAMKDALMEYETIDADQVDDLMARRKVRPPHQWDDDEHSGEYHGWQKKTTQRRAKRTVILEIQ